jgi:hypothetical protein
VLAGILFGEFDLTKKQRAIHSLQNEWLVHRQGIGRKLDFFYGDCVLFTNFHTAFAAEAFLLVHWVCLTVDQFVNIHGANIDAFGVASALVFVNRNLPHFLFPPFSLETNK